MTDPAYNQKGAGKAEQLNEARELQATYASYGATLSRDDALQLVREKQSTDAAVKALKEAMPGFTKDGHGIMGPQPDGARKLQVVGADGEGEQMQVKNRRGGGEGAIGADTYTLSLCLSGAPATITVLVAGAPELS